MPNDHEDAIAEYCRLVEDEMLSLKYNGRSLMFDERFRDTAGIQKLWGNMKEGAD